MTDKLPWLGLRSIPGVGLVLGQRLLQRFGGPAAVFQASAHDLTAVKGITQVVRLTVLRAEMSPGMITAFPHGSGDSLSTVL
jgi:ERCC4-type nuclease